MDWRLGILGQALLPLALGTTVVVGTATVLLWRHAAGQERVAVLRQLAQRSEGRSLVEQPVFDRVARQVGATRDLLVGRVRAGDFAPPPAPLQVDGTRRLMPRPGEPPVALFMSPQAAGDVREAAIAAAARALLVELAPLLAEHPANLTIAVPGRWLVGWGGEACELVDTMLPDDPVLLPAEQELLGEPGPVRWSRAYLEPASGRQQVVATTTAVLPGTGRVAVAQVLPVDEILRRATAGDEPGGETLVLDASGQVLAATHGGAHLLAGVTAVVPTHGPAHELTPLADGSGLVGVSRLRGPDWVMATVHPESAIAAQARATSGFALIVGGALLAAQAALLVLVLRSRVAHPLQQLSQAAGALTAGRRDIDLPTGRSDEVGELSSAFAAMSQAVAERERELCATAEALREREQMARALIASAADAVMIVAAGRIVEANPRAGELFGARPDQLLGRRPDELSPALQPDGRSSAEAAQVVLAQALAGSAVHFSWRCRREDGSEFDAEIGLARIELPGEARMVAVLRDVTRRNQLEEQLRQGQKLESLGQLAGGIAHDFNNMLAGIMGSAELLRRTQDAERRILLADMIVTAAERAAGLTAKLLAFARKGRVMSSVIDLHHLIAETRDILVSTVDKRIAIVIAEGARRARVVGDAAQLQNALINLVVNARDAMPEGGQVTITTRDLQLDAEAAARQTIPVEPGDYVEVAVADTGTGIPAAVIGRIFEPFFTTKPVGKGTGLGLSAVWGTVREHRGSISVTSPAGSGAIFRILLPQSREGATAAHQHAPPPERVRRGTVLVVEDEALVRAGARLMLEELGWKVIEAVDGRDGLAVFARERVAAPIDVVMVDMEMPHLRGSECLRGLRELDPAIPVVLCSGFARESTPAQLRQEGFTAQITKPYRLAELERVLDAAGGRR